jgi:predicted nucleic acid-binding protein
MSRVIFLDAGPLGQVSQRKGVAYADACQQWIADCITAGHRIIVPEIADYEVRRELVRSGKTMGIARLDFFNSAQPDRFLPITTLAMRLASDLWAQARNRGWATADPHALDGDVILAAQALTLGISPADIVVATTNVAHLSRYLTADTWENITP